MSSVNNQDHQDPATRQLKLRCKVLEIDNQAANFRCDEYRKLLLPLPQREPPTPEPEPVAPVGLVVIPDAAVAPEQHGPSGGGQVRAVRTSARVSRGGGRGLPRSRQSASARPQISIPAGPRVSVTRHPSPREGHRRFSCRAIVEHLLSEAGLRGSSLGQQDAALARVTPDLTSKRFTQLFGGSPKNERPQTREYNIVCFNQVSQPYAPRAPGEPGVLFIFPSIVRSKDDYMSFHLFIDMLPPKASSEKERYRYLGNYSKVPARDPTVNVDEWLALPTKFRYAWSLRVFGSNVRTVHARISISNARPQGDPPSPDEIDGWVGSKCTIAAISNAFNSGKETIQFDLVKCIGYDGEIAGKIQG